MPPATAMSMSPVAIPCAASITAFSPEPHTLLIVIAATRSGSPPRSAACLAGFWPSPAVTTLPMMHSSTRAGSIPARRTASATTSAPSCGAVKSLSAPRNLPVGVRTALTITESRIPVLAFTFGVLRSHRDARDGLGAEQRLQAREDHAGRTRDLARPLRAGGVHDERAAVEPGPGDALDHGADGGTPGEAHFAGRERRATQQLDERAGNRVRDRSHVLILSLRH